MEILYTFSNCGVTFVKTQPVYFKWVGYCVSIVSQWNELKNKKYEEMESPKIKKKKKAKKQQQKHKVYIPPLAALLYIPGYKE